MVTKTKKSKKNVYRRQYFLPHARLNKGQRKYCHCLMKARPSARNPYAVCQSMRSRVASHARTKKARRQLTFNPYSTNCVMSYDFNDYSLEEVQALAKEKGIDIYYHPSSTGITIHRTTNKNSKNSKNSKNGKPYSKDKLVEKITQYYLRGENTASRIRKKSKTIKASRANKGGIRDTKGKR